MKLNENQRQLFLAISFRLASVSKEEKFRIAKKSVRKKSNSRIESLAS